MTWRDDNELFEPLFRESVVRLPGGFLCYGLPADAPAVTPPPSASGEAPAFGCFNNLAKINPRVVKVWGRLLERVPDATLLLKNSALADAGTRDHFLEIARGAGIDPGRVRFSGHSPRACSRRAIWSLLSG